MKKVQIDLDRLKFLLLRSKKKIEENDMASYYMGYNDALNEFINIIGILDVENEDDPLRNQKLRINYTPNKEADND